MDSFDEKRLLSVLERIAAALERHNDISEKHLALIREELTASDARLQTLYAEQATLTPLQGEEEAVKHE
jgi:hypothetical protein